MKAKISIISFLLLVVIFENSCRKDFTFASSDGHLSFSLDTVYLDTVFKGIASSTYSLKVYNTTKDDILIPTIALRNGEDSYYRLNVDGRAGNTFNDIPVYAEDSLFVFIETNINFLPEDTYQLLYTDAIQFDTDPYLQEVELVTLVKDAVLLFPNKTTEGEIQKIKLYNQKDGTEVLVEGFELKHDQLHFTNERPYVVYGYAVVPENKQLTVDAGTRVHFHNNSGLLIEPASSLQINGTFSNNKKLLEGEVIFEGDRLEPSFSYTPGQWGTVFIAKGSVNNSIDHLTIKNAQIGLYVEGNIETEAPTLTITNSQIHNSSINNLWAKSAHIISKNLLLGNSGSSSLICELGGRYEFIHSTIANYWTNGFRIGQALKLSNYSTLDSDQSIDLMKADFKNCIIDGNSMSELLLSSNQENSFNYSFENCLIKFKKSETDLIDDELYNFDGPAFQNIILNGNPDFYNPKLNDFRITLDSDVINMGNVDFAQQAPFDLLNIERIPFPDLGVYQASAMEE